MFGKIKYWFQNYWYYYKWPVILAVFFVVVIVFCVVQSESREDADAYILFAGPKFFELGEKETMQNTLAQTLSDDHDGDGEKRISIIDMPAFSDDEITAACGGDLNLTIKYATYTYDQVGKNFHMQVMAGDAAICLVAPHWFELLKENDGLAQLSDPLGYLPAERIDDYGVPFASLKISEFCNLPEDTIICFRRPSTASAITGRKEAQRKYDLSVEVFKDLFAFS